MASGEFSDAWRELLQPFRHCLQIVSPCPQVPVKSVFPNKGGMMSMKSQTQEDASPSALIDARIKELGDWRGEMLARIRALIKEADPDVVEEWKWRGVPVWSHDGIICTGETYKNVVKLTFAKGASLDDPAALFNASLEGNTRRAIDIHDGEQVDADAFKALVRAAVALNTSKARKTAGGGRRA
jgi:hypothetical protein